MFGLSLILSLGPFLRGRSHHQVCSKVDPERDFCLPLDPSPPGPVNVPFGILIFFLPLRLPPRSWACTRGIGGTLDLISPESSSSASTRGVSLGQPWQRDLDPDPDLAVGFPFFGLATGCLGSHVVSSSKTVAPLPINVGFEEAAAAPTVQASPRKGHASRQFCHRWQGIQVEESHLSLSDASPSSDTSNQLGGHYSKYRNSMSSSMWGRGVRPRHYPEVRLTPNRPLNHRSDI